jgi:hypothetical protein
MLRDATLGRWEPWPMAQIVEEQPLGMWVAALDDFRNWVMTTA